MKKAIFALATLTLFTLEAKEFKVKTWIEDSSWDAELVEFIVNVKIEQINDNSAPIEFATITHLCVLDEERVGEKFENGKGGYIVKALIHQGGLKYKLKTSVTILDAEKKEIFNFDEDKEL
ncbi:MAG TPA: hypothetical protein VFU89_05995 [Rhabdochlamydiaceae bacterium]|nr:hypothetical protein [Rhabdochlamydiaceae bacterium]